MKGRMMRVAMWAAALLLGLGAAQSAEPTFPGLRAGDWARYGLEREDGTVRRDAGVFLSVREVGDHRLRLAMVAKDAADAREAEAQLRAMGRPVYPEVTTPDAVRIALLAVRDPEDPAEMEKIGMPKAWAKDFLAWVAENREKLLGDDPDEARIEQVASVVARRLAQRIRDRRADTEWHIEWRTGERESEIALDRSVPELAPLLLVSNVVDENARFEEDEGAAADETVRVGDRDLACRKRVLDARVNRQGMRTDYRAESWMADALPWGVARCRLVVNDLPDEANRIERYTLRLLDHGHADTRPAAPYFGADGADE